MKKVELTMVRDNDLDLLMKLADVVLDSDDAKAYCRGLGTTPKKLEAVLARCNKMLYQHYFS